MACKAQLEQLSDPNSKVRKRHLNIFVLQTDFHKFKQVGGISIMGGKEEEGVPT